MQCKILPLKLKKIREGVIREGVIREGVIREGVIGETVGFPIMICQNNLKSSKIIL
jgi:hypothetical protein